jgi:hypothetical protein
MPLLLALLPALGGSAPLLGQRLPSSLGPVARLLEDHVHALLLLLPMV